eukprot:m.352993 g.352993  ORF g.352993 m.352993 type:complete len:488 (+) comp16661_c0_seq1:220-1683(+)
MAPPATFVSSLDDACLQFCANVVSSANKTSNTPALSRVDVDVVLAPLQQWVQHHPSTDVKTGALMALWTVAVQFQLTDAQAADIAGCFVNELTGEMVGPEDVWIRACNGFNALCCRYPSVAGILQETESLDALVGLTALDSSPSVSKAASNCLAVLLTTSPEFHEQVLERGIISSSLAQFRKGDEAIVEGLIGVLRILLLDDRDGRVKRELQEQNGISALLPLLQATNEAILEHAIACLGVLAESPEARVELSDHGYLETSLKILSDGGNSASPVTETRAGRLPPLPQTDSRTSSKAGSRRASQIPLLSSNLDVVQTTLVSLATVLLECPHAQTRFYDLEGAAVLVDVYQSGMTGQLSSAQLASVCLSLCEGEDHASFLDQGGLEILTGLLHMDGGEAVSVLVCQCLEHLLNGSEPVVECAASNHTDVRSLVRHFANKGGSTQSTEVKAAASKTLKALERKTLADAQRQTESYDAKIKRLSALVDTL